MNDEIEIIGLRLLGVHGALASEQHVRQPFRLDLRIASDFGTAAKSDDLADTIDYGQVVARAAAVVEKGHFQLLEALAEAIADAVLADRRASAVTVRIAKLRPPVPADLERAGVRITRRQPPGD